MPSDHCMVWAEFFYGVDHDKSKNEDIKMQKSKRYKIGDSGDEDVS